MVGAGISFSRPSSTSSLLESGKGRHTSTRLKFQKKSSSGFCFTNYFSSTSLEAIDSPLSHARSPSSNPNPSPPSFSSLSCTLKGLCLSELCKGFGFAVDWQPNDFLPSLTNKQIFPQTAGAGESQVKMSVPERSTSTA